MNDTKSKTNQQGPVFLMARFWACLIDLLIAQLVILLPLLPITHFLPRLDTAITFVAFVCLILYFWVPFEKGQATIGQSLLGYKIIPCETGSPNYIKRLFLGYIAASLGPVTLIYYADDKTGVYWWDERSNTRAVRTTP